MTDDVPVEGAGGAGGAIVPTDPAAGASGQPLQVWLARVVGTTDAISPDDLFDGDLLARALIDLPLLIALLFPLWILVALALKLLGVIDD